MPVHELTGCTSTPLASYLKALGVLRLVAEQVDPAAKGQWTGRRFVLRTVLEKDELTRFFLDTYQPTPLVSPWNGGSGFWPGDQEAGIGAIENSAAPRMEPYRNAIAAGRRLVAGETWALAAQGKDPKRNLVQLCRNELPDDVVRWIDTAVVLTSAKAAFPPLLGTGGNVGRLEFSNNFMQRLVAVLGLPSGKKPTTEAQRESWLRGSLWDTPTTGMPGAAIGQFDPASAGGANSGPHGDAGSLVNPWDYVLLLEGALGFSSGAARRMGEGSATAAMPFTVRTTPIGFGSAAGDESTKGELWAPLWDAPASWPELSRLLAEGRGDWQGKQATTGLDFVRAIGALGVDRGITSFERFLFAERHGQNMLAVPVGSVTVREQDGIGLLGSLDHWTSSLRWKERPASVDTALRQLDTAQFALAQARTKDTARLWQEVLAKLAALEAAVARSPARQFVYRPVTGLRSRDWARLLDDGSDEWSIAASIASGHTPGGGARSLVPAHWLRSIEIDQRTVIKWRENPVVPPGPDVLNRLAAFLQRRLTDVDDDDEAPVRGKHPGFAGGRLVSADTLARLVDRDLDEARLGRLLDAALLLDWSRPQTPLPPGDWPPDYLGGLAALVAPFVGTGRTQVRGHEVRVACDPSWGRRLAAGRPSDVEAVVGDMLHRLRVAGAPPRVHRREALAAGVDGRALAAALLLRMGTRTARGLLERIAVVESTELEAAVASIGGE